MAVVGIISKRKCKEFQNVYRWQIHIDLKKTSAMLNNDMNYFTLCVFYLIVHVENVIASKLAVISVVS